MVQKEHVVSMTAENVKVHIWWPQEVRPLLLDGQSYKTAKSICTTSADETAVQAVSLFVALRLEARNEMRTNICPSVVIARKLSKTDSALWNTTKEVRTADSFAAFNPPPTYKYVQISSLIWLCHV